MKASEVLAAKAKEVDQAIRKAADNGDFNFILTDIPDQIRKRTRLGKGVDEFGGPLKKLKQLTNEKYKDLRKKSSNLSEFTTANKSNLTATGQLLDSIEGKRSATEFVFRFKDQRKNDLQGNQSKVKNSEIVEFQEKQGRKFFYLAKPELVGLSRKIRDVITKRISNLFK